MKGWYSRHVNQETGNRPITFDSTEAYLDRPIEVPCGKCIGCKLEKSRQWAMRAAHEASLYEDNSYITLTFNEKHYPKDHSVHKKTFQDFMKRYRKEIRKHDPNRKIRYLACGEYGASKRRPHYHAIIFNWRDPKEYLWTIKRGFPLYRSPVLEKAWQFGHSIVGDVTFESAAYVARYVTKKITGDKADKEYELLDRETGEIIRIEPEFALMSRGDKETRGIGFRWYQKYKQDTEKEYITINGMKVAIPDYYQRIMQEEEKERYEKLKLNKVKNALKRRADNTEERRKQKEKVYQAKNKLLIRSYEEQ